MELNLNIKVEIVDSFEDNKDTIARVYYPNEGNKIKIVKGLNVIELSDSIFHEIGHLVDWYISNGEQSTSSEIREENAEQIGNALRFKEGD